MGKFVFGALYMLGACLTFNSAVSFQERCRNQEKGQTVAALFLGAMWPLATVVVGGVVVVLDVLPECRRSNEKVT